MCQGCVAVLNVCNLTSGRGGSCFSRDRPVPGSSPGSSVGWSGGPSGSAADAAAVDFWAWNRVQNVWWGVFNKLKHNLNRNQ